MNTTKLEELEAELDSREHEIQTMHLVLVTIKSLGCMNDELLDLLAGAVTYEQVARASSERNCD